MTRRPQSPPKAPPNAAARAAKTLRADARSALQTCPAWNARAAARRLTQFFEERLGESGLSFSQFGLMAEIASAADDTLGALAERMGLDQSTLSRTLRTLEGEGLVEIAFPEGDQRRRVVWLTETGARRLETALVAWRQAQASLDGRLRSQALLLVRATEGIAAA
jgi:DNA-binding MarR family transcriptional regulator